MIRVLVADDHAVVRAGIVSLLEGEEGIEVVGEAVDGEDAVGRALALRPDLVVMDVRMPGLTGDQATARIRESAPEIRVLVLTTYESDASILAAIEAGASGYLLKAAPAEELVAGVRSVAAGEVALSPADSPFISLLSLLLGKEGHFGQVDAVSARFLDKASKQLPI